jgi:hypothetical protein
MQISI